MSRVTALPVTSWTERPMAKKKEKIHYVDDGRTVADMSGVGGSRLPKRSGGVPSSTWKERWQTYLGAVKMMLGPMLTVIVALVIIYMILWAVFFFLA